MNLKNTAGMAEKYRRYMAGKPRVYPEFLLPRHSFVPQVITGSI
jgi:hypothetical protein